MRVWLVGVCLWAGRVVVDGMELLDLRMERKILGGLVL